MIGAVVNSVTEGDKRGISKWDEGKHITAPAHFIHLFNKHCGYWGCSSEGNYNIYSHEVSFFSSASVSVSTAEPLRLLLLLA